MFILYHFIPCTITSKPVDESESRPGSKSMRLSTSSKLPFLHQPAASGNSSPQKTKDSTESISLKRNGCSLCLFQGKFIFNCWSLKNPFIQHPISFNKLQPCFTALCVSQDEKRFAWKCWEKDGERFRFNPKWTNQSWVLRESDRKEPRFLELMDW